ncbi:hypothetical protein HC891_22840 [Candidatus Gracilibacteria bacterium]|nr:hypothetical protein [Candidatus Gracilibacteria bacterium]
MHLIITSYQRLGERFGAWELRRTQSRLLELHTTRQQRGLRSKIVSVETGMPERGITGVDPRDALAVRDLILLLDQEIGPLESVLIAGGPQIMPFHACADPLGEDERSIPSDHPYSVRDASSLLSDWAVARLPAESASVLLRLLLLANRAQHAVPRQLRKFFAYSSATWQTTSRLVLEEAGMIAPLVSAPPTGATSLDLQMLESADRIYCNLHGINDGPFWYGQATGSRGAVVVALRPQDVAALDMRGSVVVSEACFGAYADGYNFDESIAMRFLLRGASCFVGATALAYGAPCRRWPRLISLPPPFCAPRCGPASAPERHFSKRGATGCGTGSPAKGLSMKKRNEPCCRLGCTPIRLLSSPGINLYNSGCQGGFGRDSEDL